MKENFDKIKSPEELLEFMTIYGFYKFVFKDDNVLIFTDEWMNNKRYYLQSPIEMIQNMKGTCWEFAELERYWFSKNNYEFNLYFIFFDKDNPKKLPNHEFLIYQKNDKFYWLEYAFEKYRGIHSFNNIEEAFRTIFQNQLDYAVNHRGGVKDDKSCLKIYELDIPPYGCDDEEFLKFAMNKEKIVFEENKK